MRLVERYVQEVGATVVSKPSLREGTDPSMEQLRTHARDEQIWNAVEEVRAAIDAYELAVYDSIREVESDALGTTGMARGYGVRETSGDPAQPVLLAGLLYGLFEHAFALLGGQAPGSYRSEITQPTGTGVRSRLRGGSLERRDEAEGAPETLEHAQSVFLDLDHSLLRSQALRRAWVHYERAQEARRALSARFARIDEAYLMRGSCWMCEELPA
jgi:hypothetical protein